MPAANVLQAFADDGLGQHGRGGGAVAGVVGGLGSHFLDELGADVLELVFEFDFLGDRHAVFGHGGGAEGALEHHVAALGAQGDFDCVGEDVDAATMRARASSPNTTCFAAMKYSLN